MRPGGGVGFLMQRFWPVDIGRLHYKSTSGANRGWRRSQLGGSSGSHFYAWWAPKAAPRLSRGMRRFRYRALRAGCAHPLRDIRHHERPFAVDAAVLWSTHYLPLTIGESAPRGIRAVALESAPGDPLCVGPATGANSRGTSQGRRKTHGVVACRRDATGALRRSLRHLLSRDLAMLARNHFDRYCSSESASTSSPLPTLVREVLGRDAALSQEVGLRRAFIRDLVPSRADIGVWAGAQMALLR